MFFIQKILKETASDNTLLMEADAIWQLSLLMN